MKRRKVHTLFLAYAVGAAAAPVPSIVPPTTVVQAAKVAAIKAIGGAAAGKVESELASTAIAEASDAVARSVAIESAADSAVGMADASGGGSAQAYVYTQAITLAEELAKSASNAVAVQNVAAAAAGKLGRAVPQAAVTEAATALTRTATASSIAEAVNDQVPWADEAAAAVKTASSAKAMANVIDVAADEAHAKGRGGPIVNKIVDATATLAKAAVGLGAVATHLSLDLSGSAGASP